MKIIETEFKGLFLLKNDLKGDARGYFMETFRASDMNSLGIKNPFVQDNQSMSTRGVLRGLHFQNGPRAQTKLVRVLKGEILDIVVDLRVAEPSFRKVFTHVLSEDNKMQLLIPRGFAHGFAVLSDIAEVLYKCDEYYFPENEGGIDALDPALRIRELLPASANGYIRSVKDESLPPLESASFRF